MNNTDALLDQDSTGGGTAEQEKTREQDQKPHRRNLVCAACGKPVTRGNAAIEVHGKHEHGFINPHGFSFHIACYSVAPGAVATGEATVEHTWFPGFAWRYALCLGCGEHLGWTFGAADDSSFFGLIKARLKEQP